MEGHGVVEEAVVAAGPVGAPQGSLVGRGPGMALGPCPHDQATLRVDARCLGTAVVR